MHWIVQDNLWNENEYNNFVDTLVRMGIPYDIVTVVPFSHDLIPDVSPSGRVVVFGSTALSKIAKKKGWQPGSFLNDNHDSRIWQGHYGDHALNSDARVCRYGEVEKIWDNFFIRPCLDNKTFSGMTTNWEAFQEWRDRVINLKETYTTLNADTMVSYACEKTIMAEYRFFVVDGKLITSSQYKRGDRVYYSSEVDERTTAFAQQMVNLWRPARGFVLDVALTDLGYRVIEINCLNSAGFYAANVQKIIEAVEDLEPL